MTGDVNSDLTTALQYHPKGKGFRPVFHALWHLQALGVVDNVEAPKSEAWEAAQYVAPEKTVHVAIIDTAVAYKHPNLRGAVDLSRMKDFSETNEGKSFDDLQGRPQTAGAHGTAVAGLIGARPTRIRLRRPSYFGGDPLGSDAHASKVPENRDPLPYSGINPFCNIVPIAISAVPDPNMLLSALTYACHIKPDVVVIADSWDRPESVRKWATCEDAQNSDGTPPDDGDKDFEDWLAWKEVEDMFLDLCKTAIVFCAAGNDPTETAVYPASLSSRANGPYAVTACDTKGNDLSYSPSFDILQKAGHHVVKTLSTELSRYDRDKAELDPWSDWDKELGLDEHVFDDDFPPWDLIATDVPGRAGYNPSSYDHLPDHDTAHLEIASLFCRFAGTSASAAIAAGLTSLAISWKWGLEARAAIEPPLPIETVLEEAGGFGIEAAKRLVDAHFERPR